MSEQLAPPIHTEDPDVDRVAYPACPLCNGSDIPVIQECNWTYRPDYVAGLSPVIRWKQCSDCGHQFTAGYLNDMAWRIISAHAQPGQTAAGMTLDAIEHSRNLWRQVVDVISARKKSGTWLDVGAGAGMLAALADECGYDVTTMELRAEAAQALRDIGLEVLDGDAHDLEALAPGRFDVVSLCDVLEHVPHPRALLDSVWHGMRDGGLLFISCPNEGSLAWRHANANGINPYWGEIEHFHNFSYRRLRTLLSEHGFEAVSCSVSSRYRICMDVLAVRVDRG